MANVLYSVCLVQSKLMNDTEMARAKRDFELKKATYDIEVKSKYCRLHCKVSCVGCTLLTEY